MWPRRRGQTATSSSTSAAKRPAFERGWRLMAWRYWKAQCSASVGAEKRVRHEEHFKRPTAIRQNRRCSKAEIVSLYRCRRLFHGQGLLRQAP